MAVPYHTHRFQIPVASDAEAADGVVSDKVVVPSNLGDAATKDVGTDPGTVASGNDTRIVGAAQKSANLGDLDNKQASRVNLGLETRQVTDFGAVGDCTGPGVGTDDSAAIADALAWFHGGNYRRLEFAPGKRWRMASAVISGTNPVIGGQIIMESPITPDSSAFAAITLQNMRDCYFELMVHEGGTDADYRELVPAGSSHAFVIKGCRNATYTVEANSYLGRVLLVDCVGGYFKNSFHHGYINCGDRSEAFLAVPCGQAIYVRGPITALGCFEIKTPWSKYSPVFDSAVDIYIPYAEFGPLNAVHITSWEFRGCGSVWLGTMLGGDETFTHPLMKFTTNAGGTGCRRVHIENFFSVNAANAILIEDTTADDHGVVIDNLVTQNSAGPAVIVDNVPKLKIGNHDSKSDYQALLVASPVGFLDYYVNADLTQREAISVASGATGVMYFKGRSKDPSQAAAGTYAHAKISDTGARANFSEFVMQGAALACFEIAGTSGGNGVSVRGGRYETTTKFAGGIEASFIRNSSGMRSESRGTATILSGQTSITVAHNLFNTPSQAFATGRHAETSQAYISSFDATNMTIAVPTAVTANRSVDWEVSRRALAL